MVVDGVTGLLTPSGDAAAFAAAVERLLASPRRRAAMGRAARRQVEAEHGLAAAAQHLDAVLSRVLMDRAA